MKYSLSRYLRNMVIPSIIGLLSLAGCRSPKPTAAELDQGLVLMLAGIEGGGLTMSQARKGLRDGQVGQAIEVCPWQHSLWPLNNLMDYQANQKAAQEIAKRIEDYSRSHPGRPVDLIGYSGGGGIALMAAGLLPPEIRPRHIILVHAAVSPAYGLTDTLTHIDGQIINYHSSWDWFMVGLGTGIFGTIDRYHGASAGRIGFDLDQACPDPTLRSRIIQKPWSFDDLKQRRWGGHLAIHQYGISRNYLAGHLRTSPL